MAKHPPSPFAVPPPAPKRPGSTVVSLRLPAELLGRLDALAEAAGRNRSATALYLLAAAVAEAERMGGK